MFRIVHSAFQIAQKSNRKLCSVDKANVPECTELWCEVVNEIAKVYPNVQVSHLYVDNDAMSLLRAPKRLDVIAISNMFGDIDRFAPDIVEQGMANYLATILSAAMMRYTLNEGGAADRIELAVNDALDAGVRTADIFFRRDVKKSAPQKWGAVVSALRKR
ncbi:MAG: isocitrate/isopropylmalate family dehydrogenase [Gammaproteobacteria bacterium]